MRTVSGRVRRAPPLVEVLFGAYRRRILALLLLRPEETFYVREIARLTGTPAGSLHRDLRRLTDAGRIRVAFVFGSIAQGKQRLVSDVDVMVIGAASFTQVVEALTPARERLRRDVNPVVMTEAAFRSKSRTGDRFVSRIMREPKNFLIADARELAELAEDRSAQGASA